MPNEAGHQALLKKWWLFQGPSMEHMRDEVGVMKRYSPAHPPWRNTFRDNSVPSEAPTLGPNSAHLFPPSLTMSAPPATTHTHLLVVLEGHSASCPQIHLLKITHVLPSPTRRRSAVFKEIPAQPLPSYPEPLALPCWSLRVHR